MVYAERCAEFFGRVKPWSEDESIFQGSLIKTQLPFVERKCKPNLLDLKDFKIKFINLRKFINNKEPTTKTLLDSNTQIRAVYMFCLEPKVMSSNPDPPEKTGQ